MERSRRIAALSLFFAPACGLLFSDGGDAPAEPDAGTQADGAPPSDSGAAPHPGIVFMTGPVDGTDTAFVPVGFLAGKCGADGTTSTCREYADSLCDAAAIAASPIAGAPSLSGRHFFAYVYLRSGGLMSDPSLLSGTAIDGWVSTAPDGNTKRLRAAGTPFQLGTAGAYLGFTASGEQIPVDGMESPGGVIMPHTKPWFWVGNGKRSDNGNCGNWQDQASSDAEQTDVLYRHDGVSANVGPCRSVSHRARLLCVEKLDSKYLNAPAK